MPARDRSRESHGPTYWRVIPAIAGRGELLIGPDEHREAALVFAPPDVLLRAPAGRGGFTSSGWRLALWTTNARGEVLVDQGRPVYSEEIGLKGVVPEVARLCPEHLAWVADLVERHVRYLISQMRTDAAGRKRSSWQTAWDELHDLQEEADSAFEYAASATPDVRSWWATPRPFKNLWLAYTAPMDAASRESRVMTHDEPNITHLDARPRPPYSPGLLNDRAQKRRRRRQAE